MKRKLIDAVLMDQLLRDIAGHVEPQQGLGLMIALGVLDALPAVAAVPRETAQWEKRYVFNRDGEKVEQRVCNKCLANKFDGYFTLDSLMYSPNYCPNCGRMMRATEEAEAF